MEDKGIKVSDISKESGIAYSTVKSILENGIGKASYINICKICEAVGITADKLENMIKNNALEEAEISKEDFEFLEKYHSLDPHGKEMVDFTLLKEWERSTAETKTTEKVIPMTVREDITYVNAAHALEGATDEEIQHDEDIMDAEPEQEPVPQQSEKRAKVLSLAGMAHEYANPALIEQEDGAFERAMAEKHALDRH